jgi:hypothetical protein
MKTIWGVTQPWQHIVPQHEDGPGGVAQSGDGATDCIDGGGVTAHQRRGARAAGS